MKTLVITEDKITVSVSQRVIKAEKAHYDDYVVIMPMTDDLVVELTDALRNLLGSTTEDSVSIGEDDSLVFIAIDSIPKRHKMAFAACDCMTGIIIQLDLRYSTIRSMLEVLAPTGE